MTNTRFAAQYIRMSTDKQDLSPSIQKEAIAAYAAARSMQVVATYEDEGRSGVHLKNRPALLRLLHDVTGSRAFSAVLVYDVSRWGRFQDTDAAAYYEYHCRLHGVQVIYVAEIFGPEANPISAMLKSMKRAMAAEYSRDLAGKARAGQHAVVERGFQMGPLPPLGYRRCSTSADGQRKVTLAIGQRKLAATDRIEWTLAGPEEVDLVKRICSLYANTRLTFADVARIGASEDWRDHRDRPITARSLATLVRNEALIGNFVWGRRKRAPGLIAPSTSRRDGCIPRLIDDETWARIQHRAALELDKRRAGELLEEKLHKAFERSPLLTTRDLRDHGLPCRQTLRDRMGSWAECLKVVGFDHADHGQALAERARQRRANTAAFGLAIAERLREARLLVTFSGRYNVLSFEAYQLRPRLLWPMLGDRGRVWPIHIDRGCRAADFDLLVRMDDLYLAKDFFVVPSRDLSVRFPNRLSDPIPPQLEAFRHRSPQQLVDRLAALSQRAVEVFAAA